MWKLNIQPEAWGTLELSFLGLKFGWRSRMSHLLSLDNNSSQLCWEEGSVQIWAGIEFTDPMSKVLGNGNKYIPYLLVMFSSVQLLSPVWLCNQVDCSTPGFPITNSQSLLKLMSIELVMPSNHLIFLSSPSPLAFNFSQNLGLFQWVTPSHQVAKVLEFQHQSFQWIFRTNFL